MQDRKVGVSPRQAPARQNRKVFVRTYGCQMNVYDSQRMSDALAADGYGPTDTIEDADLILINTCHIREKAAEKVYSDLGRIRKVKQARSELGQDTLVGVAGCVAQAEGEEIIARSPVVDLVIGPQSYHRLPGAVSRARSGEKVVETDYAVEDKFEHLPAPDREKVRSRGVTAFLTVQEGCDKFCAFCVVPYTRGSEVSRPVAQIIEEARNLTAAGVREITLLGQNVNAWHGQGPTGEEWSLGRLLFALAEIEGVARLRYVTSHPNDMDSALIAAHRDLPQLMPYLHLPVQSGSDRILKAMNRRHSADDYRRLIGRIREARPDIAMSGDFIVGFPGETDEDFERTMDLVGDVFYAQAYSFKYSRRPGTPGATLEDQVPETAKSERLSRLQALLTEQQQTFARQCVGTTMDILLEKPGRREGQIVGRSPFLQPVVVDAATQAIGSLCRVDVTGMGSNSLFARLRNSSTEPDSPEAGTQFADTGMAAMEQDR